MANDGETVETLTDFIFWGSKITADGDCSLGRKVMTNIDSILKSRVTIYNHDVLIFLFGTSLFFQVQF